ncbi:MAG: Gfo/Idh/MocA family oxidoreductase [Candidatus Hydrogenedentes bacterium]|nr:Gfo/Idh/MocA family oxidoreductase [Candidatus Hydrogenedentota bacterium]
MPWFVCACAGVAAAAVIGTSVFAEDAQPAPLKVGVVGYEGHGLVWTNELNGGAGPRFGLRVSHVWHKAPVDAAAVEQYGFEVVANPGDMIGAVDGVIIAEELPHRYRELAEPFLRAGVPTFLNRPLAGSAEDAAALIRLASDSGTPIFAASTLAVDPVAFEARDARSEFEPIKVANVTGPSDHFWWYVPHALSPLITVLGPGIEEVEVHDFAWAEEGVRFRNPLVIFFRYGPDSAVGPVRGTIQVVPATQEGDWYGFRLKLYGRRESPEYRLLQPPAGVSGYAPVYEHLARFFRTGECPFTDAELFEVPLAMDMILRSGLEDRPVLRSEYETSLAVLAGAPGGREATGP